MSTEVYIRQLTLLLVQSVKLQLRLALAIGALAASECLLLLSLVAFPVELLIVAAVPFLHTAGAGPSRKLAEWGLYFLEWAPRAVDGGLQPNSQHRDTGAAPADG
jgi:hypothetical protein